MKASAGQSSTYMLRRKGNREDIAALKDGKGRLLTDSIEKANSLNFCYSSVFGSECRISQIECANSRDPFGINTRISRRRLAAIGENKPARPDSVSAEILKVSSDR
jgi:hypothetical protein